MSAGRGALVDPTVHAREGQAQHDAAPAIDEVAEDPLVALPQGSHERIVVAIEIPGAHDCGPAVQNLAPVCGLVKWQSASARN